MNLISSGIALIRDRYARSFAVMNLLFYGCIAIGMSAAFADPAIATKLLGNVQSGLKAPASSFIVDAYLGKHLLKAALYTFLVNFILGTLIQFNLPSLVIPFAGVAMGVLRATLWGIVFSPVNHAAFRTLATHWPVMVMEGQGYILGMLSVYIQGKGVTSRASVGAATTLEGYKRGLFQSLRIMPLVMLVLAVSAIYEAAEVIYLVHK